MLLWTFGRNNFKFGKLTTDGHDKGHSEAGHHGGAGRNPDCRFLCCRPDEISGECLSGAGRRAETKKEKEEEMSFTVKAMCRHGELMHRRKTEEAALKKARELSKTGCYDLHIVTPQGRDYASSEFADIPRTPVVERPVQKIRAHSVAGLHQRFPR